MKTEPQLFCGFPLVSCAMCMSERMCALINLIWDLWRKSLAKHPPPNNLLSPLCAIEFSRPTLQLHAAKSQLSEQTTEALLQEAAFKPCTCFSPLNKAKAALVVPPAALEKKKKKSNTILTEFHPCSFPKLLWYSTQLTLVNPSYKYPEQSLSAQSSSAGLEVRAFPVF